MLYRFLLAATIAIFVAGQSSGQEDPVAAIFDSEYVKHKDAIAALIELQTDADGNLGFARRWELQMDRENANETEESRLEAAVQRHIDAGKPERFARMMAERELGGRRMGGGGFGMFGEANPAVCQYMGRLHTQLGGGGMSSSGSGRQMRTSYRGDRYSMSLNVEGRNLQMKLFDDGDNQFDIHISESPSKGLFVFRFNSFDTVVQFVQRDGEARFSYIAGEEANVVTGTSYADIVERHPGPMYTYLHALWDQVGILEPMTFAEPEALKASIAVLDSMQNDESEVLELMETLNSDSLGDRKEAAATLTAGFYKWKYWIKKSKGEFQFDKISKDHLKKILKSSPGTRAQDYASSLDFTKPKTLLRVLEAADEEQKAIVVGQLQSVTGEQFSDVSDWQEYVADKE